MVKNVIFTDGSDLEGVENVQDIKYMKLLRFTMRVVALWPTKYVRGLETQGYRFFKAYTFFIEVICLLPGLLYLKNKIGKLSFFELGHTYITVFMNIVAVARISVTFMETYQILGGDFINVMHLFHHRNKSEYCMKTHVMVHKMCHFFTNYVTCIMVVGILLFNATPLYNNISSGALSRDRPENVTFEHSVYYEIPFDYTHNFRGFIVIFSFNWYISVICSSLFCIFDLYISLLVFHIFGHLRILIYNLENFPRPEKKVGEVVTGDHMDIDYFTKEEQDTTFVRLKEVIDYHRLITQFTAKVSNVFGPSLFISYAFHQVSGCLVLLECSQMDPKALMRYGPLTVIIFQQLIQISIVFELIGSLSETLINAVYSVPWECMDTRNRKLVYVLLNQSQVPIGIKAMGMVNVGVQTMAGILKTSFSYFIMLRTVTEE